ALPHSGLSFISLGYMEVVPSWCADIEADPLQVIAIQSYSNGTWIEYQGDLSGGDLNKVSKNMIISFSTFIIVSLLYGVLDIALSTAIWSAASVGTPTEPRGRDKALRSLIWIKIVFMNLLLVIVLGSGIYLIADGRKSNYGCGGEDSDEVHKFESSAYYSMFSVVMFTYAVELLLWPSIGMNQIGKSISSQTNNSRIFGYIFNKERRHRNTAACLGGCFKCLQCMSCNKLGGKNIRAQVDLKDASVAFMDFFNQKDTNFDIALSDVWLSFKMLGRVHRERKYKLIQQARMDKKSNSEGRLIPQLNLSFIGGDNDADESVNFRDENEIFDEDGINPRTTRKRVLRHTRASDVYHIRQAARYSHYALGVYDLYPDALLAAGQLVGGRSGVYHPRLTTGKSHINSSSSFPLTDLGFPETALVYGTFANDILATPYCILVDEREETVVVSIRGTASIEDMVTDMQFSSAKMDRVGEACGFDGKGIYAHRGMLTKAKFIYNDIARRKVLSGLLPSPASSNIRNSNNPCHAFNLIFTGHSLGAGIASILSTMFRPRYPELKCIGFCPPGCSVSMNLAMQCEDYVTSVVVGNDIVPRIRGSNFEMLRFEFLEMLARVKVSKIRAWRDIRIPCPNKNLEVRNKKLLYPKNAIPMSEYFQELKSFQQKRERKFNQSSPVETRLNLPGRIIHLVHGIDNKCLPYWKSPQSLCEIDLSLAVLKEHNMDNLVIMLNKIASDFDNALKGISEEGNDDDDDDDDDETFEPDNGFDEFLYRNDFSSDDRWFILCSRPHGSVSLIPTLLTIAAFCCAALGNNLCSLFFREVEGGEVIHNFTMGVVEDVAGLSLGLYAYGVEYYHSDVDDYVLQCSSTFPEDIKNDIYIKMARGFSALALIVGFPVMCVLGLANCMMFSQKLFRRTAVALFFVAFSQSMIFIFLRSEQCYDDPYDLSEIDLKPCRLDNGSKLPVLLKAD
ncbi:hypothetical protein ACHAXR_011417, partial [Thalassiosira sp. AJA248-18]